MATSNTLTPAKYVSILVSVFFVSILAIFISLKIGSVEISFSDIFRSLFSGNSSATTNQIILELRLPRILLAFAVGGGLSIAGAVFQSILLNPLAEPFILGISSGGTFGALLSISSDSHSSGNRRLLLRVRWL